ncbi:glycosyltransferase family 4 protein [Bacillus sp. JJ1521]|uniref:glycosyltransferase family 4 protein n=1 Tax=Bacillus sp. JJ1521 TaxID=3122957 RepID=UPI002FFD616E
MHIAPNSEIIPPVRDGGTERVVSELTEELIQMGYDITLFAPKGSKSSGKIIHYPFLERDDEKIGRFVLENLPENVDIIHDHTFSAAIGRFRNFHIPVVNTIHLPFQLNVNNPVYVSSNSLQVIGGGKGFYVHNGLRPEEFQFKSKKDDYLLFMGRLVREKGILHAINVAESIGKKLVIAGPIHDPELFYNNIKPRLEKNPNLIYVGSVGGQQKQDLLKNARCLLFPSTWDEPFGLVMIEAMACGTPVLTFNKGSVAEVMKGFPYMICSTTEEMIEKLKQPELPVKPKNLRRYVIDFFTVNLMAENYLNIYKRILNINESLPYDPLIDNFPSYIQKYHYYQNILPPLVSSTVKTKK